MSRLKANSKRTSIGVNPIIKQMITLTGCLRAFQHPARLGQSPSTPV
jgi:hypothetical protein